jgi:glycerophosphoryl diester phosphodiesterase
MIFLAHRGHWLHPEDRNSPAALARAVGAGYGLETDIRDHDGALVVAHDPARGEGLLTLDALLDLFVASGAPGALALNIKADGLQAGVTEAVERRGINNAFVFDMSLPDTLGYLRRGARFFSRQSEYEPAPLLYEEASGVWIDCFERDWITPDVVEGHLAAGKQVALVSPELHGRPHGAAWSAWRPLAGREGVLLCTDFPDEARAFFQ